MFVRSLIASLILAWSLPVAAHETFGHRAYGYYGYDPYADREIARLRHHLNQQQFQQEQDRRAADRTAFEANARAFDNQRASSRQACYDRTTGGFEICADLFDQGSSDHVRCEQLVVRRNPSCNRPEDIELPVQATP